MKSGNHSSSLSFGEFSTKTIPSKGPSGGMVDAADSKSATRKGVKVQFLSRAH
jgi:hypothetical protein